LIKWKDSWTKCEWVWVNRVLVVDDEPDVRSLIYAILVGNGFEVFQACSGEEGLVLASRLHPDLVVLDIVLPGLSGFEVCRLVKGKYPDVKVLILSALDRDVDHKYAMNYGADGFLSKPFSVDGLLETVDSVLG